MGSDRGNASMWLLWAFILIVFGLSAVRALGHDEVTSPPPQPLPTPTVPHLAGMNIREARETAADGISIVQVGYSLLSDFPKGTILRQRPPADSPYVSDQPLKIRVIVAVNPVVVPDLSKRTLHQAKALLRVRGMEPDVWKVPSSKPAWTILSQSIKPGTTVHPGMHVRLKVAYPHLCGSPLNPWCYSVASGSSTITDPPKGFCDYFTCVSSFWSSTSGYVIQCADGEFSHSGGVQGSCSSNGGNWRPLYRP